MNAALKATSHGWRLARLEEGEKIDAAVAPAMPAYLAEAKTGSLAPSFAQMGGVG